MLFIAMLFYCTHAIVVYINNKFVCVIKGEASLCPSECKCLGDIDSDKYFAETSILSISSGRGGNLLKFSSVCVRVPLGGGVYGGSGVC